MNQYIVVWRYLDRPTKQILKDFAFVSANCASDAIVRAEASIIARCEYSPSATFDMDVASVGNIASRSDLFDFLYSKSTGLPIDDDDYLRLSF